MGNEPSLVNMLMDLQDAGIKQGQALGRGDPESAAKHHRDGLLLIDALLLACGESGRAERMPHLNAVSE